MKSTLRLFASTVSAALLASLSACSGNNGGDGDNGPGTIKGCSPNDGIMKALASNCAGCHTQGSTPFFASLSTFESLLVYNEKYVVPGHPEQSYLVRLLQGAGEGTYKQMPLSGDSFVKLAAAGNTEVTLAQIEAWITALTPRPRVTTPDPGAVTVQRQSAEQIRNTLYAQLGLTQDDFFQPVANVVYGTPAMPTKGEDNYPLHGADELPATFEVEPHMRHAALGGGQSLEGRKRDLAASSPFAQTLVAVSQRWCKIAIAKPTSTLLFPHVDRTAKSATAADDIQKNLGYLHLHFLGEPADPAEIEDVFQNVFLPLEAESDPPTAWAGVCSYFIRHPKWIFY